MFLEYLFPVLEDIENPAFVKEWMQNTNAVAYEKYRYKDENVPSIRKKMIVIIKQNTDQKA